MTEIINNKKRGTGTLGKWCSKPSLSFYRKATDPVYDAESDGRGSSSGKVVTTFPCHRALFIASFLPFAVQKSKQHKKTFYTETKIVTVPDFIYRIRSNAKTLIMLTLLSAGDIDCFKCNGAIAFLSYCCSCSDSSL